jgi:hypothetical protein
MSEGTDVGSACVLVGRLVGMSEGTDVGSASVLVGRLVGMSEGTDVGSACGLSVGGAVRNEKEGNENGTPVG